MEIAKRNKKLVMIAGPSSSGKTTFSRRLSIQLMALGLHPHPITVDNYFRDRELAPIGPDGKKDFESIKCVDIEQFSEDMLKLLAGRPLQDLYLRPDPDQCRRPQPHTDGGWPSPPPHRA